jgi:hypothetical protein
MSQTKPAEDSVAFCVRAASSVLATHLSTVATRDSSRDDVTLAAGGVIVRESLRSSRRGDGCTHRLGRERSTHCGVDSRWAGSPTSNPCSDRLTLPDGRTNLEVAIERDGPFAVGAKASFEAACASQARQFAGAGARHDGRVSSGDLTVETADLLQDEAA